MKSRAIIYFLFSVILLLASCAKNDEAREPNYTENTGPTCIITYPVSEAVFFIGDTIHIVLEAEDPNGYLTKVLILIDGVVRDTLVTSPYTYTWITNSLTSGTHVIACKAYDYIHAVANDEVEVSFEIASSFIDGRDGQSYEFVTIENQIWMAENLNYDSPNYISYDNNNGYGKFYTWEGAMNVCPAGWHLPSDTEWKLLELNLGMSLDVVDMEDFRGSDQGSQLKATTSWNEDMEGFNSSGFSAMANGFYNSVFFTYEGVGEFASFWTATEGESGYACNRWLNIDSTQVSRNFYMKSHGYSVRCVKD